MKKSQPNLAKNMPPMPSSCSAREATATGRRPQNSFMASGEYTSGSSAPSTPCKPMSPKVLSLLSRLIARNVVVVTYEHKAALSQCICTPCYEAFLQAESRSAWLPFDQTRACSQWATGRFTN